MAQSSHNPQRQRRCTKNTKAAIKIAGLNIKGHGSTNIHDQNNKWGGIDAMIRTRKIGILVIGEAHLDSPRRDAIEEKYPDLKIFFTKLDRTANAAGAAIALNRKLTNTAGIQTYEIVAGHALLLEMVYHQDHKLSILAIYAPNIDTTTNTAFWNNIRDFFTQHPNIRKPDLMLGDFNMVEEPLDRLPPHPDAASSTDALDDLKVDLQMEDGWRNTFPTRLEYTYTQTRTGYEPRHSRLDRIYVKATAMEKTYDWKIEEPIIKTDHMMVSTCYTSEEAPEIGRGRWTMPTHLLYDKEVKEFIHSEGLRLNGEMLSLDNQAEWDAQHNAQTLWKDFKSRFINLSRQRAKIVIPKIEKNIADTQVKINSICNDPTLDESERSISLTLLQEKLRKLLETRRTTAAAKTKAMNHIYKETISRHWTKKNREQKPRDIIWRLEYTPQRAEPTQARFETASSKMADMMRDHHQNLQYDTEHPNEELRTQAMTTVLHRINTHLPENLQEPLRRRLSREDTEQALTLSANYKAPGIDGITYETWKILDGRYTNALAHEKQTFDIIDALQRVYNDIELNGMAPNTNFSESWLCPLYKKNDRACMANYRPISLLNTDYKIMTKALTLKL
ncbi:hypothetical protein EV361DRAFT_800304, partial [Lentinula raphanica]